MHASLPYAYPYPYAKPLGPYIEMLVPRRKGQLLKLLILVPLSLLLATSIYYQFYYEQPSSQRPPLPSVAMSAPLIYNPDQTSKLEVDAAKWSKYARAGGQSLGGDMFERKLQRQRQNLKFKDSYTQNEHTLLFDMSASSQAANAYKLAPGEATVNGRLNEQTGAGVYNLRANRRREKEEEEEEQVRGNRLDEQTVGLTETSGQHSDGRSHRVTGTLADLDDSDNGLGAQEAGESGSRVDSSERANMLREEEEAADAQDAAVIPPPSDPSAPGEFGRPVVLRNLTKEQQDLVNVGWENNAFNQYISDIISVNRTLPDVRDPSCKDLRYPSARLLPRTSVIICFHNEAWSVLLRTIHSILNRSPRRLIKEIILVDDFSNKPHLGQQLDDYVKSLKVVKVVRAKKREGLIRARLLGAQAATAQVLTFLDSHCECAEGWLEPLLTRIYEDRTAVVCPVIDVISDKTFEYHYKGDASAISVGGFDWNLQFNWHSVPEREKKRRLHNYDPLRSPTMAGGLFSIDKAFFERLGTYDSGFDIWGGENLELSFKTWMCGGSLEILPCSHVGHVFRSRSPYKWRSGVNVLRRNSVRLAEVWMDDYKKYYYDRIGHDLGDFGDVSDRIELRKRLNCKPFSYFVKEIYPELFIPGEAVAYGEVRNEAGGKIKMCLDSSARKSDYHKPLGVYPCHGSGGNQYWLFSRDGEIRRDEACVDYAGHEVVLFPCHGSGGNQLWLYDKHTAQVRHSTSGRCMELARDRVHIRMSDCDPTKDAQKWTFQHYNATLAANRLT